MRRRARVLRRGRALQDSLQFTSPFAAVVAVAATALLLLLARVDRHETKVRERRSGNVGR